MLKQPFKPIYFYETLVPNIDEAKADYYKILKDLEEKDILRLENRDTSSMKTCYFANDDKWEYKMKQWEQLCFKYLADDMRKFLSLLKHQDGGFTEIWTQISNGFQMHHPHTHGDVGYSFAWYVDVDENEHEGTFFYSPHGRSPEDYQTKLELGKLIIFPSWILHYQPPSNSSIDRCIVSGNIKIG